jgi:hypothetical protein
MKIDFSKVEVKDIEGNVTTVDISKELGNMMYLNAQDIAVADLGHEIYHKKEVELTKEQAQQVRLFVDEGFKAFVKRELLPVLDSIK